MKFIIFICAVINCLVSAAVVQQKQNVDVPVVVAHVVEIPKVVKAPNVVVVSTTPSAATSTIVTKIQGVIKSRRFVEQTDFVATINPCDLQCTKLDYNPVCATNGDCVYEFANQCVFDAFNCKHSALGFKVTRNNKCEMHSLRYCDKEDFDGAI